MARLWVIKVAVQENLVKKQHPRGDVLMFGMWKAYSGQSEYKYKYEEVGEIL